MNTRSIPLFAVVAAQALMALACMLAPAAAQTAARPAIDSFFQNPAFSNGRLSPTGRFVALGVAPKDTRTQLVVMDVEKQTAKVVAGFTDADIERFDWVNDERLVFSVHDWQAGIGDIRLGPGLYAVNRDGTDFRQLATRQTSGVRDMDDRKFLDPNTRLLGTTRGKESDDVFIVQPEWTIHYDLDALNLLRLNTRTGRTTPVNRPGKSFSWVLDSNDVPRVSTTYEAGRTAVHYLQAEGQWRKLADFDAFNERGFAPLALGPDGSLYVTAYNRSDKRALYRFDLAKNALDPEPVVSLPDYDLAGNFVMTKSRLLGMHYESDAPATVWFDAEFKQLQQKVDALLPGTINRLFPPERPELPVVLVRAFSDADPGTWLLYNTQTAKVTVLGPAMRGIDPRQMAAKDMVRYKARDGLEIPAYLTLPKGPVRKNLPMVVLVHGGPWVRDHWNWDADSQFLASRGYAVLQPQYRGSTGFGYRHFRSGWKQWGLAMQNDVADGARWAIAQGIADPGRICIAGASYGGYATLMGLVNDPDLYRCGVNWVGVTDIELMYSVTWSDFSLEYKTYGMPRLVGDREKDAEQLKATSPIQQAARIRQPLLMAYGGADRRVPIVHGIKFRDAVQKTNPHVEWIEYTEEGHGWDRVKNRVDFWSRVEKFLDRNIGSK